MTAKQLQEKLYDWAVHRGFDAPYGVLTGEHTKPTGARVYTLTFGRRGTLDVSVEIYNHKFILTRTSRHGVQRWPNAFELQFFLETL